MSDELGTNLDEPVSAPAPKVQRAKAAPAAATVPAVGMPKTTRIQLEESVDIPPNGLFIGHNGRGYLLKAGEPVDVPDFLLNILNDAMVLAPQVDPTTKQVIGYRERLRYPYRQL